MIFSRLNSFIIITCLLGLYPFANTQAFDGKREGFFFGIGLEPGISVDRTAYSDGDSYLYGRPSFTLNCKIGYALSETVANLFNWTFYI